MQVNPISRSVKAVDEKGRPTQELNLFTEDVSKLAIVTMPISGNGDPDGLIEAPFGKFYFDKTGLPGSRLYFKQEDDIAGDKSLGWALV